MIWKKLLIELIERSCLRLGHDMRGCGVQDILVDVIERIYDESMVKFKMESIMTGWCKSDSGVIQGCLYYCLTLYDRELDMKVAQCKQGFK